MTNYLMKNSHAFIVYASLLLSMPTYVFAEGVIGYTDLERYVRVDISKGANFDATVNTTGDQFALGQGSEFNIPSDFNYHIKYDGTIRYYGSFAYAGVYTLSISTQSMYIDWDRLINLGGGFLPAPPGGPEYGRPDFNDWFEEVWDPIKDACNQIADAANQIASQANDPWYQVTGTVASATGKIHALYGDLRNAPAAIVALKNKMQSEGQVFEDKVRAISNKLGIKVEDVYAILIKYAAYYAHRAYEEMEALINRLIDGRFDPRTIYGYRENFHFTIVVQESQSPVVFTPSNPIYLHSGDSELPLASKILDYSNSLGSAFDGQVTLQGNDPRVVNKPVYNFLGGGVKIINAQHLILITPGVVLDSGNGSSTLVLRCKVPSAVN